MHSIYAKSILSAHNGTNVYRGCTHGCIYCDSRSLCYHTPIPFEDIEVKQNAPELLEIALRKKRKKCMIGTGSMCDPYMHCESNLGITRKCLEIIYKYGFGATVITKSDMILRDIDILKKINDKTKCVVQMTLTTFDDNLCKIIEPNVCVTSKRFEVLKEMRNQGIPTVVWLCPILPFINDTEENLLGLLNYCNEANVKGIINFGFGLTLRDVNREYFYSQLDRHFPNLKLKYQHLYGNAYEISSPHNVLLNNIFKSYCTKNNIMCTPKDCFEYLNEFPKPQGPVQLTLPFY